MPTIKDVKEIRLIDPGTVGKVNRYRRRGKIRSAHNAAEQLIALGYRQWQQQTKEQRRGKDGITPV